MPQAEMISTASLIFVLFWSQYFYCGYDKALYCGHHLPYSEAVLLAILAPSVFNQPGKISHAGVQKF